MPRIVAEGFGWLPFGASQTVLQDLSLLIEPGERVLLAGPSGAGKSTVLSAIAGVLSTAELGDAMGRITIDGEPAAARTHQIGLVRQDPETNIVLARIDDELRFAAENIGCAPDVVARRAHDAAVAVGLADHQFGATARLSGGQKQRLAIAAIAAMQPAIWLLDEPTAQLDPAGAATIVEEVLHRLRPDDTLVLVEHTPARWWPHLTRVVAIDLTGELVLDCSPGEALTTYRGQLESLGVWLPGDTPSAGAHSRREGDTLISLVGTGIGRSEELFAVDMELTEGRATLVRGRNGSGKSTLALTLAGLIPPTSGSVRAAEVWSPRRRSARELEPIRWTARELSERIAPVFQQPDLQFVRSTVREEIRLGAETSRHADEMLESLGLAYAADRNPRTLSGGEKRRLSVATALASPARLVVADEPTFGQDRHTWHTLVAEFSRALSAGRSLCLPSHDPHLASVLSASEFVMPAPMVLPDGTVV